MISLILREKVWWISHLSWTLVRWFIPSAALYQWSHPWNGLWDYHWPLCCQHLRTSFMGFLRKYHNTRGHAYRPCHWLVRSGSWITLCVYKRACQELTCHGRAHNGLWLGCYRQYVYRLRDNFHLLIIMTGVIQALFPELNYVSSLCIAACLTPTDPVTCVAIIRQFCQPWHQK